MGYKAQCCTYVYLTNIPIHTMLLHTKLNIHVHVHVSYRHPFSLIIEVQNVQDFKLHL